MIILKADQVQDLCSFVENSLDNSECDHSLRHTIKWAKNNAVNQDDLIDVLELNGGYCDCEVIMNLPEDVDLHLEDDINEADLLNPFKIPSNFKTLDGKVFTKAIFSSNDIIRNNYTKDGELLIPAPFGYKARKRVRKSVHFFNGIETELPTELGYVKKIDPITGKDFAKQIRDLKLGSLARFSERDAEYYLSRVDRLKAGDPAGTYFMEKNGIGGKKIELKIHKVFVRG